MSEATCPVTCLNRLAPSCVIHRTGQCPAHRTGLKVTVTERRDGLECSHPGCTYQPGHLGAHSNEEEPS